MFVFQGRVTSVEAPPYVLHQYFPIMHCNAADFRLVALPTFTETRERRFEADSRHSSSGVERQKSSLFPAIRR
jgi:hypothetical protein